MPSTPAAVAIGSARLRACLRRAAAALAVCVATTACAQPASPRPGVPGPSPTAATATALQQRTDSLLAGWLQGTGIAASDVGLFVVPVEGGDPLASHDAGRPFNPASTMKLVTTYAALSILGPEFRWSTGVHLRGSLDADVLRGDLVLRGGGDPKLVIEDLAELVARMRAAGLREIAGDLVIDDSLFDVGSESVERFDLDLSQPYNVRPHAMLMNFKATRVVVRPGAGGADISLDPPLAGVPVDNEVRIVKGPCRFGAGGLAVRTVDTEVRGPRIRVSGRWTPSCGEQGTFVSVLSHPQFIGALFGAAWEAAGGAWNGQVRVEPGAARGRPWLEWVSPRTLADVVRDINKFSNNVMARQVFLMLSPDPADHPATLESARAAVGRWLARERIDLPGLSIDNGSGLSRSERVGAASLAGLLRHAAASPHSDLMRESLPLVGIDGTMRHRLVQEPLAGRAWIKTGSLSDVRAIAGYVDASSGRRYVVVMLVNGPRAAASSLAQDRLLRWVHDNG